ncbi:MBL fold metallo-hydrolase [Veillonella intestinalis]|uniref:MBL fold metallo-hydrolase n=1 Tax=Veillonella intestinalis TaxID=2941341 RepID=UPI00203C08BA|nr:MBL fold metallo-hydrolase [Veillonella intestinalis]
MTQIVKQPLGLYKANCYVLKEAGQAIVIDPGFHAPKVLDMVGNDELLAIVLTHGHCDHICAVDGVRQVKPVPVYMHPGDDELLHTKRRMPSAYKGLCQSPYIPLSEGKLEIGPFELSIFETPGHSKGSVVIQWENHIFTGDTLFKNSVGATNNYNGDAQVLAKSLQRIMGWDPKLIIHPGHAEDTTLEIELIHNPYLKA